MEFNIDPWALPLFFVALFLYLLVRYLNKKDSTPSIGFSYLPLINSDKKNKRVGYFFLPTLLIQTSFVLFLIAFLDPHLFLPREKGHQPDRDPVEGRAIYLVLDRSGSMGKPISGHERKIDLLKRLSKDFVFGNADYQLKGRNTDLIGIIGFARKADVLSPLTLDHQALNHIIDQIDVVKEQQQEGTAIGYALYKTANWIEATRAYATRLENKVGYTIKNPVIILLTDGFQNPHPEDVGNPLRSMPLDEAVNFAKENGIRLYIINVEQRLLQESFRPHRNLLSRLAESTGGKLFLSSDPKAIIEAYEEIDALEPSQLPLEMTLSKNELPFLFKRISFFQIIVGLGMGALLLAVFLECVLLRRVP